MKENLANLSVVLGHTTEITKTVLASANTLPVLNKIVEILRLAKESDLKEIKAGVLEIIHAWKEA